MSDIRVIVDDNLKQNVEIILKELDLTMSQAVRMFLKQIERRKELPFNPYKRSFNQETESAIKRANKEENLISYNNVDDMFNNWNEDQ